MRRNDKEIEDDNIIEDILLNNTVCRIGFIDGKVPYVISMNYGYSNMVIYVHTAPQGKKMDIIKANNNVCVEITDSVETVTSDTACNFGTRFRSLVCRGTIHLLTERDEKREGLKLLMKQHSGSDKWEMPDRAIDRVNVLKIELETITGKISGM